MRFRVVSKSRQKTETYDTLLQGEERARELDSALRGSGRAGDAHVEPIGPPRTRAVAERGKQSLKRPPRSAGVGKPGRKKNRKRNPKRAGK
jgi:hypothetical protein